MIPAISVSAAVVIVAFFLWKVLRVKRVIVYEYQKALKYTKGKYVGTLEPGQYWIASAVSYVYPVDMRPDFTTIQGQDVLSSDGVTLKVSLACSFQVDDPNVAVNNNVNFKSSLYLIMQMALREIVGNEKIDVLLENRANISAKLMELGSGKATELGLKLNSADIKDIMFPGEMKKVFAQVVKAQKEGQAALERARGETAALRSLANAARIMQDNPNLLQLRALQALADSSGNSLVFGLANGAVPLPKKNETHVAAKPEKEEE
jgi:regulator of protease activity HflC (stomatin/prohibitin superfamily)